MNFASLKLSSSLRRLSVWKGRSCRFYGQKVPSNNAHQKNGKRGSQVEERMKNNPGFHRIHANSTHVKPEKEEKGLFSSRVPKHVFEDISKSEIHGEEARSDDAGSDPAKVAVKHQALKYLAKKSFSAAQLRKKLEEKKFPLELVDAAIHDLQKCGLQSDLAYAETYARSRWNDLTWGPQRIKEALERSGITKDDVNTVLQHIFKDAGDEDQDCLLGMSKSAKDHLVNQAKKHWISVKHPTYVARVKRMITWLESRGFDENVIDYVFKCLPRETQVES